MNRASLVFLFVLWTTSVGSEHEIDLSASLPGQYANVAWKEFPLIPPPEAPHPICPESMTIPRLQSLGGQTYLMSLLLLEFSGNTCTSTTGGGVPSSLVLKAVEQEASEPSRFMTRLHPSRRNIEFPTSVAQATVTSPSETPTSNWHGYAHNPGVVCGEYGTIRYIYVGVLTASYFINIALAGFAPSLPPYKPDSFVILLSVANQVATSECMYLKPTDLEIFKEAYSQYLSYQPTTSEEPLLASLSTSEPSSPPPYLSSNENAIDLSASLPGNYVFFDWGKIPNILPPDTPTAHCTAAITVLHVEPLGGNSYLINFPEDVKFDGETCESSTSGSSYVLLYPLEEPEMSPESGVTRKQNAARNNTETSESLVERATASASSKKPVVMWYGLTNKPGVVCSQYGVIAKLHVVVMTASHFMNNLLTAFGTSMATYKSESFVITIAVDDDKGEHNCMYGNAADFEFLKNIYSQLMAAQVTSAPSVSSSESLSPSPSWSPSELPSASVTISPTVSAAPSNTPSPSPFPGNPPSLDSNIQVSPEYTAEIIPEFSPESTTSGTIPPTETASPGCFPAHARVQTQNGTLVSMEELQIGDSILDATGQFSKVVLFTHSDLYTRATFMHIQGDASDIMLSPSHYLYVNNTLRLARHVNRNDVLTTCNVNKPLEVRAERVLNVRVVRLRGLFNPQTESGSIAVIWGGNAVAASTYTSAVEPRLAHGLVRPLCWLEWALGITMPKLSFLLRHGGGSWGTILPKGGV